MVFIQRKPKRLVGGISGRLMRRRYGVDHRCETAKVNGIFSLSGRSPWGRACAKSREVLSHLRRFRSIIQGPATQRKLCCAIAEGLHTQMVTGSTTARSTTERAWWNSYDTTGICERLEIPHPATVGPVVSISSPRMANRPKSPRSRWNFTTTISSGRTARPGGKWLQTMLKAKNGPAYPIFDSRCRSSIGIS